MATKYFDVVKAIRKMKKTTPDFTEIMFLKQIGISKQAFFKHKKDPSMRWCIDHAERIALFFGISIDQIHIDSRPQGQKKRKVNDVQTN